MGRVRLDVRLRDSIEYRCPEFCVPYGMLIWKMEKRSGDCKVSG